MYIHVKYESKALHVQQFQTLILKEIGQMKVRSVFTHCQKKETVLSNPLQKICSLMLISAYNYSAKIC